MTRFYAFDPYTAVWRLIARDGCDYVVPTRSRIIGTRHGDEQNDLHVSMLYFHPKCAENGKDAKALLTETNGTKRFGLPYAEAHAIGGGTIYLVIYDPKVQGIGPPPSDLSCHRIG